MRIIRLSKNNNDSNYVVAAGGIGLLSRRILPPHESSGIYRAVRVRLVLYKCPHSIALHFDTPPSGACDLRLSLDHRVRAIRCALSKHALKGISRRRDLYESKRRDPRQYLRGEPRVQFHLNRRFLRRKILSGATGEGRSLIGK